MAQIDYNSGMKKVKDEGKRAKSSAIIYSITETAKANWLKVYDDVEHLLTEKKQGWKSRGKSDIKIG